MSECNRHVPRLEFDVSIDGIVQSIRQQYNLAVLLNSIGLFVLLFPITFHRFAHFSTRKIMNFVFLRIEKSIRWPELPFEIAKELYGQYELIEYKRLTVACQLILHTILRFHVIVGFTELLGLYHSQ